MAGITEVNELIAPSPGVARRDFAAAVGFSEPAHPPRAAPPPTATVLVCDRLRAVADSLAEYLGSTPGLAVPAVATGAAQLLALLDAERCDLVVLDSTVPYQDTVAPEDGLVAAVRRRHPATRVLMIGPTDDSGAVARALREGAQGWLSVESSAAHLAEAAHGVLRGDYRIAPNLLAAALGAPAGSDASSAGNAIAAGRAEAGSHVTGIGAVPREEPPRGRRSGLGTGEPAARAAERAGTTGAVLPHRRHAPAGHRRQARHRGDHGPHAHRPDTRQTRGAQHDRGGRAGPSRGAGGHRTLIRRTGLVTVKVSVS
jgi:DNA-binding NarL/FixJ family response regulator